MQRVGAFQTTQSVPGPVVLDLVVFGRQRGGAVGGGVVVGERPRNSHGRRRHTHTTHSLAYHTGTRTPSTMRLVSPYVADTKDSAMAACSAVGYLM